MKDTVKEVRGHLHYFVTEAEFEKKSINNLLIKY